MPFKNSNQVIDEIGDSILRLNSSRKISDASSARDNFIPIVFGLNASDPTIDLDKYLEYIISKGYAGINNYPSLGLIDGSFSDVLEKSELNYDKEVEAIRLAHKKDFFTVAYVFNSSQAAKMASAGADVICAHLGLTKGGTSLNISSSSIHASIQKARNIFEAASSINPHVIRMIYSGPISTPIDAHYTYANVDIDGYIGGSTFDRIPIEAHFKNTMLPFQTDSFEVSNPTFYDKLNSNPEYPNYVALTKQYIEDNFMYNISVLDIANFLGISRTRLSDLFRKEMGITLSHYIIQFKMKQACKIMKTKNLSIYEVARFVGYEDYAHFSKIFKKYMGLTPKEYKVQFFKQPFK